MQLFTLPRRRHSTFLICAVGPPVPSSSAGEMNGPIAACPSISGRFPPPPPPTSPSLQRVAFGCLPEKEYLFTSCEAHYLFKGLIGSNDCRFHRKTVFQKKKIKQKFNSIFLDFSPKLNEMFFEIIWTFF